MNVFEDLVLELREENLLEDTVLDDVIDQQTPDASLEITEEPNKPEVSFAAKPVEIETAAAVGVVPPDEPVIEIIEADDNASGPVSYAEPTSATQEFEIETNAAVPAPPPAAQPVQPEQNKPVGKNKEFFKKRAIAEVSSLQMVEHVLTGVEREYMKVMPNTFDDFKAKKALNNFLQSDESVDSEGHAAAEFELMQETEAWCSALEVRDKKIPVSSLRHYCENTRPALSSQALVAIARFYRNLPYSEDVRSKFDYVMTRLFSRGTETEKRVALFNRQETLTHIKTLYADWSSIPLYSADDNDSHVMLSALSFEDLAHEAENASSFDQLIKTDFFVRLRTFKESLSEIFFAPIVAAAAIEANVRIGNAYVSLIARERRKMDNDSIHARYSDLDHGSVSDATARTLELVDILKAPLEQEPEAFVEEAFAEAHRPEPKPEPAEAAPSAGAAKAKAVGGSIVDKIKEQIFSFNKWVLVFCGLLLAGTLGLVVWSSFFAQDSAPSYDVAPVSFEGSPPQEFVAKAKIARGMLYVQLQESWDRQPKEKRQAILEQMLTFGAEKGFSQITLIGKDGKMMGYASATKMDIVMP